MANCITLNMVHGYSIDTKIENKINSIGIKGLLFLCLYYDAHQYAIAISTDIHDAFNIINMSGHNGSFKSIISNIKEFFISTSS